MNTEIKAKEVQLVGENGKLTTMPTVKALQMADDKSLDLIVVSQLEDKPICKIIDYKKFIYDQSKKEKENRKKQVKQETKTLKFSLNIGEHDMRTKLNHAKSFLEDNIDVQINVQLKGREVTQTARAIELMDKILSTVEGIADIKTKPVLAQRDFICIITPKK